MNASHARQSDPHARARVVVVGEPLLHAVLAADPDIDLYRQHFESYDAFVEAASNQRIPFDQALALVVSSELNVGPVSLDELLTMMGDITIVVGQPHRGAAFHVPAPADHDAVRAAIGVCTRGAALAPLTPVSFGISEDQAVDTEWHFERSRSRAGAAPGDAVTDSAARPRSVQRPAAPQPPHAPAPVDLDSILGDLLPPATPSYAAPVVATPQTNPQTAHASAPFAGATATPAPPMPTAPRDPGFFTGPNASTRAFTQADMPGPDTRVGRQMDGCKVFAVYSPKGGVGKTSIAVNLAAHVAMRTRLQVCIVDLDVGFGNVGTRLGVFTPTIRKLLVEPELDQEALARNLAYDERTGLHALLAPLRPEAGADRKLLKPAVYDRILALLVDRFDIVFLDCSVELNDPLVAQFALARAHKTIVVVNNEQATLLDARRAVEAMTRPKDAQRLPGLGMDPNRINIVLNQKVDGVGKEANQIHELLTGGDPNHPNNRIPIIATFPDDRHLWVGQANLARTVAGAGVPEIDAALDDAMSALFDGAVDTPVELPSVWHDEAPMRDDSAGGGLLSKFAKRFRK